MARFTTRKYQALLITLIALVFVYPILGHTNDYRLFFDILLTLVFVSAMLVLFTDRKLRVAALMLGGPVLVGAWTSYFLINVPRKPVAVTFHILTACFLSFTVAILVRKFYRERSVSADAVYASFCGYLLLGLAFGHIFSTIEWLAPGSFLGNETIGYRLQAEWHRHFLLVYFSFMTMTTVGYGDMTPAADFARGMVVIEAIAGQFYLAVLVAELIGRRVGQRHEHDHGGHEHEHGEHDHGGPGKPGG